MNNIDDINRLMALEDTFRLYAERLMNVEDVISNEARKERAEERIAKTQKVIDTVFDDTEEITPQTVSMVENTVDIFTAWAGQLGVVAPMLRNSKLMHRTRADQNERLARIDALTQSGNRLAFGEQLTQTMKLKEKDPEIHTAVFLFDLDRFKGLNDDYGHAAGDAGLKAFAEILKEITRQKEVPSETPNHEKRKDVGESDIADSLFVPPTRKNTKAQPDFRFGGDEFALIVNVRANSDEEAEALLLSIQERIKEQTSVLSFEHDGMTFPLLSSIGMHIVNAEDTPHSACEIADNALMIHKRTKKERYEHCVSKLEEQGVANLQEVEDKRADEATLQKFQEAGAALYELGKNDGVEIHVPAGTEPNAVKALEATGVKIVYNDPDEPSAADENTPS